MIGTSDIARGAVTSSKIQDETIRSKDIRDGKIRGKDVAPSVRNQTSRWVLVNAAGQIEDQSGGFTLDAGYPVLTNTAPTGQPDNSLRANGNVYIGAGENIDDNGLAATIVLQNTVNQGGGPGMAGRDPGPDANPEFSGEISVSRCNIGDPTGPPSTNGPTNCAPPLARNADSFVVSPRNSDGSVTTNETGRKRFFVVLTGS